MPELSITELRNLATAAGLSLAGVTSADTLVEDRARLQKWQSSGHAGEMVFMERDPSLLATPELFLPSARSVVVLTASYDQSPSPPCPPGHGRVARYAWGRDYHKVLRKRLESLLTAVRTLFGDALEARCFSDSVPLLERALARSSGGGFIGKNTMFITPGVGSFTFLSEIIWNVTIVFDEPLPSGSSLSHRDRSCGSCTSCLTRCPTGAFVEPFSLDARRCISYLTIEKRTALSWEERGYLGNWIFGCDICQEVCPFNFTAIKSKRQSKLVELRSESGVGALLSLSEILRIRTDAAFVARFGGTAIMRTKRSGLLRNAAVVAGNTCAESVVHDLIDAAREDSLPIVRQHAVWGAAMIAKSSGSTTLARVSEFLSSMSRDVDAVVRGEVHQILSAFDF